MDINPITPQRTGTLETYLPQAEEYLDGVRESRMNEAQKEVEVTLTVAECGEFHNYGEYHEGITSVEEALKIFESIPPDRLHGNPQIGIQVHTVGDDPYQDSQTDVVSRRYFDLDALTYVPDIACNAKAMDMIAELISRMPDTEIRGEISAELQGRIDVYTLEQLANDIDRFTYDVDPYEYRDNVSSREENVEQIKESIETGNGAYIQDWLQTFVTDGNIDDAEQAKELLKRIDDYKPLAKVEELEEQNYNMIDNVLNNGAGEKERDKKEKVEQVERSERPSLKEKLEEKKFEAANHSISTQPKLNDKNADREVL